jgi:ubiquinone/menaquinone biosynthesis C-methylase UbiE
LSRPPQDPLLTATHQAELRHFWFRGLRRFLEPLLVDAATGLSHPLILDCGCGTGANLELLGRFGRAYGVDRSEVGIAHARGHGQRLTALATVVCLPFPAGRFDIVTSLDVLTVLDDDAERAALAEMHRVLRPGGAAIINVAALDMLRGNHAVLSQEVRRYTRTRLREAVERAGFEILRLTYTNASTFPLVMANRLTERMAGLKSFAGVPARIAVPPGPVNRALTGVLAIEARLLRWMDMPIGSSLLCLARTRASRRRQSI